MPGSSQTALRPFVLFRPFRPLLPRIARLRNRHHLFIDVVILLSAPVLALWLRKDTLAHLPGYGGSLGAYTVLALIPQLSFFYLFGLYKRFWKFATVDDLFQIALAVLTSTVVISLGFYASLWLGLWGNPLPRSIPLITGLLTLVGVGGSRFCVRLAEHLLRRSPRGDAKKVLIVGAGGAGQAVAREMRHSPQLRLCPVGFLDDDAHKHGMRIMSLPVFGGRDRLPEVVRRHSVAQVVIAIPNAPGKTIREYLSRCEKAGVPAKTVPGMSAILGGRLTVSRLRKVEIEDLLRRDAVHMDIGAVQRLVHGKRVLITGGGGSIGSELCRQVLQCEPRELAILGHGENSVFEIQSELIGHHGGHNGRPPAGLGPDAATGVQALIADIRIPERVYGVIERFGPDIIFHAAAHKHVPLMECNPPEAVTNNVFGTLNLLEAAVANGVDRFVMISTDKAVNPTSVMGASKRAAELLVLRAASQTGRPYVAVRFGNVLGSRGSVVPTFKRQIAAGGPITVSHPEMKRYFMTIPEAVQLVLQAAVLGKGGEIFMLDMGEPVRIVDLARDLTELSGLEIGRDIDIEYTGVRPGEKLFEELFIPGERYERTEHPKILIARNASSFVPDSLDEVLSRMRGAVEQDDDAAAIACLRQLIPEFEPQRAATPRNGDAHAVVEDRAAGAHAPHSTWEAQARWPAQPERTES